MFRGGGSEREAGSIDRLCLSGDETERKIPRGPIVTYVFLRRSSRGFYSQDVFSARASERCLFCAMSDEKLRCVCVYVCGLRIGVLESFGVAEKLREVLEVV